MIEKTIGIMHEMKSKVPEEVYDEYIYFSLSDRFKKYDYHLKEAFPNHVFEYFNDSFAKDNIVLNNHSNFINE